MDFTLVAFALAAAIAAFVVFVLPRLRHERPRREQRLALFILFVSQLVFIGILLTLTNRGWDLGGWPMYAGVAMWTATAFGAVWLVRRLDR